MAVNLLEEDRLVYHDTTGSTLQITIKEAETDKEDDLLVFESIELRGGYTVAVEVNGDAVETLRDVLTCWLETGKLKR